MFYLAAAVCALVQQDVCVQRAPEAASPFANTKLILSVGEGDSAFTQNSRFFETHLLRLQREIENCKKRSLAPKGDWTDTQNKIVLELKKNELDRLKDLYEKYKKGELPTVKGRILTDLISLKVLVGDPVTHMGHIPVGTIKGDGEDRPQMTFIAGSRNLVFNQIQEQAEQTKTLEQTMYRVLIPRGVRVGKVRSDHLFDTLKAVGLSVSTDFGLFVTQELADKLPKNDEEFSAWLKGRPASERKQINKDLRNIGGRSRRAYQVQAWLMGTQPSLAEDLAVNAQNAKEDRLAKSLVVHLLSPADKKQSDEELLSAYLRSQRETDSGPVKQRENWRRWVRNRSEVGNSGDRAGRDFIFAERLRLYAQGKLRIPFALTQLSDEAKLWVILSGYGEIASEGSQNFRSSLMNFDLSKLESIAMGGGGELKLRPIDEQTELVAAALLLLKWKKTLQNKGLPESLGNPSEEEPPKLQVLGTPKTPRLPPQVKEGSADALAFTDFYGVNQVTQRLSSAVPTSLDLKSFRKSLGLNSTSTADRTAIELHDVDERSALYPQPELQGSAVKDPSYACQTYAVVSDLDRAQGIGHTRVSNSYSYALTVAEAELHGPPPDEFYAAMMEAAQKKAGMVLPGQVEAIMDTGGGMEDALKALSRTYTVDDESAPKNSKGEAYFPESITDFSLALANEKRQKGYKVEGHGIVKIKDYSILRQSKMADAQTLQLIIDMIRAGKPPIVEISSDARTLLEDWFRPVPGNMAHYLNIVDVDFKTSAFDAKKKMAFLVRDSFATEPIHYWVSVEELMPYITGIASITRQEGDIGFLTEEAKRRFLAENPK